jgi:hypothetical protein
MELVAPDHPLRRLFSGLVENAFCAEVGMCDPTLTAYVTDLLVDFTRSDRLLVVEHGKGKRLDQLAAMMIVHDPQPAATQIERDRRVYRNIGDYTLFWAGVYPEQLKRAVRDPADVLVDYVAQGKKSYAIVSKLADDNAAPPPSLFRHLSEDFETCLHGLGLVRRSWEQSRSAGTDHIQIVY